MFNNRYFGFFIALMMAAFFIIMYGHVTQKLSELKHLRQMEKKLRVHLQTIHQKETSLALPKINKVSALFSAKPNKISDILQNMIQIIEENGFTIQTLKPPELKGIEENIFPVRLLLKGPVNQMVSLLTHLSQENWTVGIQDFSLQIEKYDTASIEMTMLLLKQTTNKNSFVPKSLSASFKVMGYVHDDKHFFALLLLPDGKTQIVQQGSIIGDEKARVVRLAENEVIISQGQQQIQVSQKLSPLSLI